MLDLISDESDYDTGQYLQSVDNIDKSNADTNLLNACIDVNDVENLYLCHQYGKLQTYKNEVFKSYQIFSQAYSDDILEKPSSKIVTSHWDKIMTIPGRTNDLIFVLGISQSILHVQVPQHFEFDSLSGISPIKEIYKHDYRVISTCISHDGALLASGDDNGNLAVCMLQTKHKLSVELLDHFEQSIMNSTSNPTSNTNSSTTTSTRRYFNNEDPNKLIIRWNNNAPSTKKSYVSSEKNTKRQQDQLPNPIFSVCFLPYCNTLEKKLDFLDNKLPLDPSIKSPQRLDRYCLAVGSNCGVVTVLCVSVSVYRDAHLRMASQSHQIVVQPMLLLNTIPTHILCLSALSTRSYDQGHHFDEKESEKVYDKLVASNLGSYSASMQLLANKIASKKTNKMSRIPSLDEEKLVLVAGTSAGVVYTWKFDRLELDKRIKSMANEILSSSDYPSTANNLLCSLFQSGDHPIVQINITSFSDLSFRISPESPALMISTSDTSGVAHVFAELPTSYKDAHVDSSFNTGNEAGLYCTAIDRAFVPISQAEFQSPIIYMNSYTTLSPNNETPSSFVEFVFITYDGSKMTCTQDNVFESIKYRSSVNKNQSKHSDSKVEDILSVLSLEQDQHYSNIQGKEYSVVETADDNNIDIEEQPRNQPPPLPLNTLLTTLNNENDLYKSLKSHMSEEPSRNIPSPHQQVGSSTISLQSNHAKQISFEDDMPITNTISSSSSVTVKDSKSNLPPSQLLDSFSKTPVHDNYESSNVKSNVLLKKKRIVADLTPIVETEVPKIVKSSLGHPSLNTAQVLSYKAKELQKIIDDDEVSISTVNTTSTDRIQAAKLATSSVFRSRYKNLISLESIEFDSKRDDKSSKGFKIGKQVDLAWLERKKKQSQLSKEDLELFQFPTPTIDFKINLEPKIKVRESTNTNLSIKKATKSMNHDNLVIREVNIDDIFGMNSKNLMETKHHNNDDDLNRVLSL